MFCSECGKQLEDNVLFCDNCGARIKENEDGVVGVVEKSVQEVSPTIQSREQESSYMESSVYHKVFVEPDEQLLGTLGNGYLENMLNKKIKKCHALLTDKRVYFQGTFFSGSGKTLQQDIVEKTIDLEDITGTGFRYSKPIGILVPIISLLIPWALALLYYICRLHWFFPPDNAPKLGLLGSVVSILIIVIMYLKNRKTNFILEYAGGCICFDAMILGLSNVKDFDKQIRRAKDKAKGKN